MGNKDVGHQGAGGTSRGTVEAIGGDDPFGVEMYGTIFFENENQTDYTRPKQKRLQRQTLRFTATIG